MIKDQVLLMLKDPLEIVHDHLDAKLGSPQDIGKVIENQEGFELDKQVEIPMGTPTPEPVKVVAAPAYVVVKEERTFELPGEKPKVEEIARQPMKDLSSNNYMPVKALNTFARDWIIKARVSSKGEKKTTRNGGFLMKIEMVDQYGNQIEGTFFNDAAHKFEHILKRDKVYLFSNGNVKMANKKFTSVRNDFCIVFEKHSIIDEAKDDGSITNQAFDFCQISDISDIL